MTCAVYMVSRKAKRRRILVQDGMSLGLARKCVTELNYYKIDRSVYFEMEIHLA